MPKLVQSLEVVLQGVPHRITLPSIQLHRPMVIPRNLEPTLGIHISTMISLATLPAVRSHKSKFYKTQNSNYKPQLYEKLT